MVQKWLFALLSINSYQSWTNWA